MPGTVTTRTRFASAFLLTALAVAGNVAAAPAADATSSSEERLAFYHNRARAAYGRAPLKLTQSLSDVARAHSRKMRAAGRIFHSSNLSSTLDRYSWTYAGENVGVGPSTWSLHKAFMASRSHRANILNSRFKRFGVGIAWSNGRAYVTVVFLNYG